jgi:hypothetical protein
VSDEFLMVLLVTTKCESKQFEELTLRDALVTNEESNELLWNGTPRYRLVECEKVSTLHSGQQNDELALRQIAIPSHTKVEKFRTQCGIPHKPFLNFDEIF